MACPHLGNILQLNENTQISGINIPRRGDCFFFSISVENDRALLLTNHKYKHGIKWLEKKKSLRKYEVYVKKKFQMSLKN